MQRMDRLPFQFTIRRLLWLTFWVALSLASWTATQPDLFTRTPGRYPGWFAVIAVRLIAPVGALAAILNWNLLTLVWSVMVGTVLLGLLSYCRFVAS